MGFYEEMSQMSKDLLKPDSQGGLGQRVITLTRETSETNEAQPWLGDVITTQTEELLAVAFGAAKYADGETILATDIKVTAAIPTIPYRLDDGSNPTFKITIDGRIYSVVDVKAIPDAGTPAAVVFIIRS
jgi:DNA-binding phage protein